MISILSFKVTCFGYHPVPSLIHLDNYSSTFFGWNGVFRHSTHLFSIDKCAWVCSDSDDPFSICSFSSLTWTLASPQEILLKIYELSKVSHFPISFWLSFYLYWWFLFLILSQKMDCQWQHKTSYRGSFLSCFFWRNLPHPPCGLNILRLTFW